MFTYLLLLCQSERYCRVKIDRIRKMIRKGKKRWRNSKDMMMVSDLGKWGDEDMVRGSRTGFWGLLEVRRGE